MGQRGWRCPDSSHGSFSPGVFSSPSAKRPPLVSLFITECYEHFRRAESWSGWHPVSLICLSPSGCRERRGPHPAKQMMKIEIPGKALTPGRSIHPHNRTALISVR